ncbi:MAG: hypothetical protein RI953_1416 [Pseudomonadota bacterium]|jgi:hypothetical protein
MNRKLLSSRLFFGPLLVTLGLPVSVIAAHELQLATNFGSNNQTDHYVRRLGSGQLLSIENDALEFLFAGVRDYQIGDEWGKREVDITSLPSQDEVYRRSVNATAFFNSATAFYLGKFAGEHVMATNHHVLDRDSDCSGRQIHFTVRKQKYRCKALIGSWPEIDLALFVLENPGTADDDLLPYAGNFDFNAPLAEDTRLLTAGFGIAGNPGRKMVVNENPDCRIVSSQGEYRLMADPDKYNPADYKAWSFATGCSVSHGDSGSSVVNRQTGGVVGIVWTGAIPKEERIQHSSYIKEIQSRRDEEIWSLLTYVVPAEKIATKLRQELSSGSIPRRFVPAISQMLGAQLEKEISPFKQSSTD